jgi:predicted cupin superfamily sugar epimerase
MNADEVKTLLGLVPHPREGGWYVRTWEAAEWLPQASFAEARYPSPRRVSTAIYYLLEPGTFSEMHRLASDEVFHHYLGAPVEMLQLQPAVAGMAIAGSSGATEGSAVAAERNSSSVHVLGSDLCAGQRPQLVVPRGTWQGSRLLPGDDGPENFALLGCVVAPGFEFEDYTAGTHAELAAGWPEQAERIRALTRV